MKRNVASNQEKAAGKTVRREKKVVVQKVQKEVEQLDLDDSSVWGNQKANKKKLIWDYYSKKELYYKWVKARNDATDLRKEKNKLEEVWKI